MKKVLVIQTAFIGDAILATAVVEKLHRFYPNAQIDFLVRKGNESLFQNHPFLNACLVWDKRQKKYRNLFVLLKQIRKSKYDMVVNLQRFAASGFLTGFSRAKQKVGFNKNPFSFLFTLKKPHVIGTKNNPGKHEVERCLFLIEHATDTSFQMPKLYPTQHDFSLVQQYTTQPFITISPASVWFTKQTPVSVWINYIQNHQNNVVYLLGAPADVALCEQIQQALPNAQIHILAGKLSLLQSAALMQKAVMNYTNDSAPMHLCSAMNANTVAVFCSTISEFGFGPLAEKSRVIQTHENLACRPCGLHGYKQCPKGHFDCGKIKID